MAKERMYGWNGELPAKEVSGQCKIVLDGLRAEADTLKTGHQWTETIGKELRTRQDPYRVVLYYILILKSKGCIRTNEFDIDATTKREDVKHGITVKTAATIDIRHEEPSDVDVANEMQGAISEALDALGK